jgi:hypothetical protein
VGRGRIVGRHGQQAMRTKGMDRQSSAMDEKMSRRRLNPRSPAGPQLGELDAEVKGIAHFQQQVNQGWEG